MNKAIIDDQVLAVERCIKKLDGTVADIKEHLAFIGPMNRLRWCLEEAVALYEELGFAPDMMFADPDRAKRWLDNAQSVLRDCK